MNLLSNGRYHVAIGPDGAGPSHWNEIAVTRWHEDASAFGGGTCHFLRDDDSGTVWSPGVGTSRHDGIEATLTIAVDPDLDVELRRLRITNHSAGHRRLGVTGYAEIVLAPAATDAAQPSFSKLFVETSIDPASGAIVATRRPSKPDDTVAWSVHRALLDGASADALSIETDRARFVGRGRSVADPAALDDGDALSGTVGPVLDAIAAIRIPFTLAPGASCTVDGFTGIAGTREGAAALARSVAEAGYADRVVDRASRFDDALAAKLGLEPGDVDRFGALAAALFVADPGLRGSVGAIAANRRGQPALWAYAISGDVPTVVVHVAGDAGAATLRTMVRAHAWWKAHGVASEMLVLAESAGGGAQDRARRAVADIAGDGVLDQRNGIVVRDIATLEDADRRLFAAVARVVVTADTSVAGVVSRLRPERPAAPPRVPGPAATRDDADTDADTRPHRDFTDPATLTDWNGHGGLSPDGAQYVIQVTAGQPTPAPWVNILANPVFGTLVSEAGSASTWSGNAHEFRLTPWSNDPVADPNTEAIYLRCEESGRVWSPTVLPVRGAGAFEVRHGFGASTFLHRSDSIESTLRVFVDAEAPVRYSWLTLRNGSPRTRRIAVTGYVEWVLGDERGKTAMYVVTERDGYGAAVFARNATSIDFGERVAFHAVDSDAPASSVGVCGDRGDFLGPHGSLDDPSAMHEAALSGRVGAALDPCAALRVVLEIAAGAEAQVVFRLGAGDTAEHARRLANDQGDAAAASRALDAVHAAWRRRLGVVRVRTPDPRVDALANGWLAYQTLASRFWGRTGFYQSSGGYGFRDQLQDAMALVHAEPGEVRSHLLRCAGRQFTAGDVQHWWHPPSGKGVRTRCSDDYLWLPFVAARYVTVTGDDGVLGVACPFLDARELKPGEASNYERPEPSGESASLHQHCVRAIEHGLRFGAHGLPLMAGGDWNDGMNLVGAEGRGESVWLAFFLVAVLRRYAPLARRHGDDAFADRCEQEATALAGRIESCAWDGDWYLRAWFDDGSTLGSSCRDECRIDAIAQSWSVISGAAPRERATTAMASLHRHLVHADTRVVQLLDPPFDTSKPSPGYIEGYVPGVRENGGQYTHAAVWSALAFARLGDGDRAWKLFSLIEPFSHGADADSIATYRAEPYVLAGDVYAFAPHAGRGGWSWYTGSAGWMYQLLVESLLGFRREGSVLRVEPLLPRGWPGFEIAYAFGAARYDIVCRRATTGEAASVSIDGVRSPNGDIPLHDDGSPHAVVVTVAA